MAPGRRNKSASANEYWLRNDHQRPNDAHAAFKCEYRRRGSGLFGGSSRLEDRAERQSINPGREPWFGGKGLDALRNQQKLDCARCVGGWFQAGRGRSERTDLYLKRLRRDVGCAQFRYQKMGLSRFVGGRHQTGCGGYLNKAGTAHYGPDIHFHRLGSDVDAAREPEELERSGFLKRRHEIGCGGKV